MGHPQQNGAQLKEGVRDVIAASFLTVVKAPHESKGLNEGLQNFRKITHVHH